MNGIIITSTNNRMGLQKKQRSIRCRCILLLQKIVVLCLFVVKSTKKKTLQIFTPPQYSSCFKIIVYFFIIHPVQIEVHAVYDNARLLLAHSSCLALQNTTTTTTTPQIYWRWDWISTFITATGQKCFFLCCVLFFIWFFFSLHFTKISRFFFFSVTRAK